MQESNIIGLLGQTKEQNDARHEEVQLAYYLIIAILYGIFILFCNNIYFVNVLVVGLQFLFFTYCFIKRRWEQYISLYIIFSSMSLEFEYMSGQFWGWKSIRFLEITVSVWFLLPLFLEAIVHMVRDKIQVNRTNKVAYSFAILNIIAVLMGIITILSGDNGIAFNNATFLNFVLTVYENITRILIPAITFAYFLQDRKVFSYAKLAVIAILFAITVQEILSLMTGIMGVMWSDKVLMVTPVQSFAPFLLLFAIFREYKIRVSSLVFGSIASVLALKYSFGSGQFIILFSVPMWFILAIIERKKDNEYRQLLVSCILLIPILVPLIANINYGESIKYKLDQAISFLKIWKHNWIDFLPVSARFRVEELRAIVGEYVKKPFLFFAGKGYMGSFSDLNNYFYTCSEAGSTHAFSQFEWNNNAFYAVHESFNKLLLTNGLLGVICFFRTILEGVKNVGKSPFLAIGIMWFLWYWGFSTTYSYFGIMCLFLGIKDLEKRD